MTVCELACGTRSVSGGGQKHHHQNDGTQAVGTVVIVGQAVGTVVIVGQAVGTVVIVGQAVGTVVMESKDRPLVRCTVKLYYSRSDVQ